MAKTKRCDLCRWWLALIPEIYKGMGECHAHSPRPWPTCGGREHTPPPIVAWPTTKEYDFCSNFESMEES